MKIRVTCGFAILWNLLFTFDFLLAYRGGEYRLVRSPHKTVMLRGYYSPLSGPEYPPQTAMTAFISGDTLATNSFLSGQYKPYKETEDLDVPLENDGRKEVQQPDLPPPTGSSEEGAIGKPERPSKRKPVKPQQDEEDAGDEEGSWPLSRKPAGNVYFPILLGGYGRNRGRDAEGEYPGSATAIANSFSTGRGGVASSHATAFGDPYANALFRNGNKRKQLEQLGY